MNMEGFPDASQPDFTHAWRAKMIDGPSERELFKPGFNDTEWPRIDIDSLGAVAASDNAGSLVMRKEFAGQTPAHQRSWFHVEGFAAHASVWIDGGYVGEIGAQGPRWLEISQALRAADRHVLAIEVPAAAHSDSQIASKNLALEIVETGGVRISRKKILCTEANTERAVLALAVELDSDQPCIVRVQSLLMPAQNADHAGTSRQITRALAAGSNRLQWTMVIDKPHLWAPWEWGQQPIFNVRLEVADVTRPHQMSDSVTMTTGLRQVDFDQDSLVVNGERVGIRALEVDAATDSSIVADAKAAGFNAIVVDSDCAEDVLSACDAAGMLSLINLPGPMSRNDGGRRIRETAEFFSTHPSAALWLLPKQALLDRRTVLDPVRRTISAADPSRPSVRLGGVSPANRASAVFVQDADGLQEQRLQKKRPSIIVSQHQPPAAFVGVGGPIALFVHVEHCVAGQPASVVVSIANDTESPCVDAVLHCTISPDHEPSTTPLEWSWGGTMGAHTTSYVGTARWDAPADASAFSVDLRLVAGGETVVERTVAVEASAAG